MEESNELLNKYDTVVDMTLTHAFSLMNKTDEIVLKDLNFEDKNHKYFLKIFLMARDMFQTPIAIYDKPWKVWLLNFKLRKHYFKLNRATDSINAISVVQLIESEKPYAKSLVDSENFNFSDIYETYYERKKEKWLQKTK